MNVEQLLKEELAAIRAMGADVAYAPVGSRMSVDPEPEGSDYDIVVCVPGTNPDIHNVYAKLTVEMGWVPDTDTMYDTAFSSLRKGSINILLTYSIDWMEKFRLATHVCHQLKLTDREDRVMVCKAVRDGEFYYPMRNL